MAPFSLSVASIAERSELEISSGQQCGELMGTSKVLYPFWTNSDIASVAVADQRYENVLMIIGLSLQSLRCPHRALGSWAATTGIPWTVQGLK